MITLICIRGGRGGGKSFFAAFLARVDQAALVFEEHEFGQGEFDVEIGGRRFFAPTTFRALMASNRLRGRRDGTLIAVGDTNASVIDAVLQASHIEFRSIRVVMGLPA